MRCGSMLCCSGSFLLPARLGARCVWRCLSSRWGGLLFGLVILLVKRGFGWFATGCLSMKSSMRFFLALRRRSEMKAALRLVFRGRVSPRRATYFSLLRQRKVGKRKATLLSASLRFATGNLRCSTPAGVRRTRFAQTAAALIPPTSALLGAARRDLETKRAIAALGAVAQPRSGCAIWGRAKQRPELSPPPLWLRRGAERFADQGRSCLSEASSADPAKREHRRLPRSAAKGPQTVGSPFFCLRFFGEAKKSRSPAGARPGPGKQFIKGASQ